MQIQHLKVVEEERPAYARERIDGSSAVKNTRFFNFDPNTLPAKGWQSFGLSPKQAAAIINYTHKGGRFYKPEDLQKMYTISPELYRKLLPFVQIKESASTTAKSFVPFEKKAYVKKTVIVDINTADSAQLDEIKGIGGTFAKRIIKYKERLGGFYKTEQLMEVYGMDEQKYAEIKDQISISRVGLKTININTAVFNDLKSNPYLSFKQINAIIQYRRQHGNYSGVDDLKKVVLLSQEVMDKITPYISF
jgi:competence ComEA-like helix-hairpin-helix protein